MVGQIFFMRSLFSDHSALFSSDSDETRDAQMVSACTLFCSVLVVGASIIATMHCIGSNNSLYVYIKFFFASILPACPCMVVGPSGGIAGLAAAVAAALLAGSKWSGSAPAVVPGPAPSCAPCAPCPACPDCGEAGYSLFAVVACSLASLLVGCGLAGVFIVAGSLLQGFVPGVVTGSLLRGASSGAPVEIESDDDDGAIGLQYGARRRAGVAADARPLALSKLRRGGGAMA